MTIRFRKTIQRGGTRVTIGKHGLTSVSRQHGPVRVTASRTRGLRLTLQSGIPGLSFIFGGKKGRH